MSEPESILTGCAKHEAAIVHAVSLRCDQTCPCQHYPERVDKIHPPNRKTVVGEFPTWRGYAT